jgi:hypothetical protein
MTNDIKLTDFGIKGYKTFRGMEGTGFNATLTLRGEPIALAMDDAHGGELRIEWKEGHWKMPKNVADFLASPEAVKIAVEREQAFRKQYGFGDDKPLPTTWAQDDFVEYLVAKIADEKEVKKLAKKHGFVFRIKSGPAGEYSFYPVPKGYKWTKAEVDKLEKQAIRDHGEIEVLARPAV